MKIHSADSERVMRIRGLYGGMAVGGGGRIIISGKSAFECLCVVVLLLSLTGGLELFLNGVRHKSSTRVEVDIMRAFASRVI